MQFAGVTVDVPGIPLAESGIWAVVAKASAADVNVSELLPLSDKSAVANAAVATAAVAAAAATVVVVVTVVAVAVAAVVAVVVAVAAVVVVVVVAVAVAAVAVIVVVVIVVAVTAVAVAATAAVELPSVPPVVLEISAAAVSGAVVAGWSHKYYLSFQQHFQVYASLHNSVHLQFLKQRLLVFDYLVIAAVVMFAAVVGEAVTEVGETVGLSNLLIVMMVQVPCSQQGEQWWEH